MTTSPASSPKKPIDGMTKSELDVHVVQMRNRLASTLDALEDKGNLPKQLKNGANKRAEQLRKLRRDKPAVFAAVVGGGVAVTAGILALVVKNVTKR